MITYDKKTLYTPEVFTAPNVKQFIEDIAFVFDLENKNMPDFTFDLRRTMKIDIVGLVLVYKYLEYTVHHKCFLRPKYWENSVIQNASAIYGFDTVINTYVKKRQVDVSKFKPIFNNMLFVAPIILSDVDATDNLYASKIKDYYTNEYNVFVVLHSLGELFSNFKSHAMDNSESVLVATGNQSYFEIVCADSGIGIANSLRTVGSKYKLLRPFELIKKATERGITSKVKSGHMGYGLWVLNEFVKILKGGLEIYSEGGYYRNIRGKVRAGSFPYWKGTIIHVKLPLIKTERCKAVFEAAQSDTIKDLELKRR